MFSQLARYRTPLSELRDLDSSLADAFESLSRRLDQAVTSGTTRLNERDTGAHSLEDEVTSYQRINREWNEVVEKIRRLEGFSSFLRRVPFRTLQTAGEKGPAIVVNISKYRSDALIILPSNPPLIVPLPQATPKSIIDLVQSHLDASSIEHERVSEKQKAFAGVLSEIWRRIVQPIVQTLDESSQIAATEKDRARIWWIPSSFVWKLPLHAAGSYKADGIRLPDRFISSYAASLAMLARLHKLHRDRIRSNRPKPLVVTVDSADDEEPLAALELEVAAIESEVKNKAGVDRLKNHEATRASVLSAMRGHPWIHFACHGAQHPTEPFNSRFKLDGEPLRLVDIIKEDLPSAELAFLAACHSAAGDFRAPNESIHLAAGMQFAGYQSVIGTMWAMADVDGPVVAAVFYKYMFRKRGHADCADAAAALAKATRELRRRGVPLDRWINFVHYGV
jgi:CHAT domain-containing protein